MTEKRELCNIKMDMEFVNQLIADYQEDTGIVLPESEIVIYYAMEGLKQIKTQRKSQKDMMDMLRGNMFK